MVGEKTRKTELDLINHEMALKVGRDEALRICRTVKPTCDLYLAAEDVIRSIDQLVVALGGKENHFHAVGGGR